MIEALNLESRAHLRHQYGTPVNHPVFQRIHQSGRELLESVRSVFGEYGGDAEGTAFKAKLQAAVLEISQPLTSLTEDLEGSYRQTLADLDAIFRAAARLLELTDPVESACQAREMAGGGVNAKGIRLVLRAGDLSGDVAAIAAKRNGGKILIDDDANRTLLRRRLESDGHEIVEPKTAWRSSSRLRTSRATFVLLDILMPAMGGFETLARMKQDDGLRDLPSS